MPPLPPESDRDYLLGVTAVRVGLLHPGRPPHAFPAWAANPARPFAAVLPGSGCLPPADVAALPPLCRRRLAPAATRDAPPDPPTATHAPGVRTATADPLGTVTHEPADPAD